MPRAATMDGVGAGAVAVRCVLLRLQDEPVSQRNPFDDTATPSVARCPWDRRNLGDLQMEGTPPNPEVLDARAQLCPLGTQFPTCTRWLDDELAGVPRAGSPQNCQELGPTVQIPPAASSAPGSLQAPASTAF
ncbi:Hypothetical predicted protein [Marmota monax]|uniref:Uncharacterized protein n=1 Tax=Marmota monax TaxID=9995 RepID=A0A5E4CB22_MARMO|nr:Hypothetical predicted protein [Marmota monax]